MGNNSDDLLLCDNDLDISTSGDIAIAHGNISIIQSAINNIGIKLHELPLQYDRGNKMQTSRIKLTPTGLTDIESYCRQAVLYDYRIRSVLSMVANKIDNSTCSVEFLLETSDGSTIEASSIINI